VQENLIVNNGSTAIPAALDPSSFHIIKLVTT